VSTVPTDHGVAALGEFVFECGQSVPDLEVAYETHPRREFDGDNVVLVCHALTGSQNVARSPAPERATRGDPRSRAGRRQAARGGGHVGPARGRR